jgi:hypothetical protein
MTTRKAITLAGLVLALAILSPTSVLAKAKCPASEPGGAEDKCRSLESSGTGTVRLNTQTLQFTAAGTAIGTHTGKGPAYFYNGQARPIGFTPPNLVRLAGKADVTIVAANGDELYGYTTFTTEDFVLGNAHEDEGEITITDGSGRFDGARGELDTLIHAGPGAFVQEGAVTWMVSPAEVMLAGYVIY